MTIALERLITELEEDHSLSRPDQVRRRLEVLDRLDGLGLNGDLSAAGAERAKTGIDGRARRLYEQLELANLELYKSIREEIQRGAGAGALLHWTNELGRRRGAEDRVKGEGYDFLDELISGVLQLKKPEQEAAQMEAEMVFYQPTPARHIFDLLARTALSEHDVFVDLGSGLGHVSLLVAACTSARCVGIELEGAYVGSARQCTNELKLRNVTFFQQDVRATDLSEGTVFYLYTPFVGAILRTVLDSLHREASRRKIRVCTFGPCTAAVAGERWLRTDSATEPDKVAVFHSLN